MEEDKDLEKSALKVFDKDHNPTNESSEAEALELLFQLPNPAEVRDDVEDQFTLLHHACNNGWYEVSKVLIEKYNCDPNCRNAAGSIPLHLACRSGNLDLVKYLILDKGCDPNDKNNLGLVPLHNAALGGHLHVTRFLIEKCDINSAIRDSSGWTPLHSAFQGGHFNVAKYLIEEQNIDPSIRSVNGQTPLHSACLNGHLDAARYLVEERRCDPACSRNDGLTPLHLACLNGHIHIVKYIAEENKCNPNCCSNNQGLTPLHFACEGGYEDIAMYLVEEQACNPACKNKNGQTPLHSACLMGHIHVAKYLIEKQKCDPACKRNNGRTPLHLACERGHLNVAKYLIEKQNVDPSITDKGGRTPLHFACLKAHHHVAEFLIKECKRDPTCEDINGVTPFRIALRQNHLHVVTLILNGLYNEKTESERSHLHSASIRGDLEIVKFLIEDQRGSPQSKDSTGLTPLHLASKHGHSDIIRYLVNTRKCSVVCKANDGSLPSSLAIANGHTKVALFLLQKEYGVYENDQLIHSACKNGHIVRVRYLSNNFNPHVRDSNGFAPLHIACENGHLEIVKLLIQEANCDPMCMTSNAWTPLHSASQYGKLDVIKYLIKEQQCDPNCRTLNGMTPLHLACRHRHFDVVVYLVNECIGDALSSAPYYGDSLMEETLKGGSDDILFFLMSHGLQFTSKFRNIDSHVRLVEPALKVFVLGNANSGKSTLIKALGSNLAEDKWFKKLGKVSGVEPYTAGIIPNKCQSRTSGTIMLYDFAGQHEHYSSSHAAILEKLRCAQNDLVFIVVDINNPIEQLVKELKYWDSFVSNQYGKDKPPVVVIGSHLDMTKQQGETMLSQALNELPQLNTYITLDCTRKSSPGLTKICKQISTYSERHHESFSVSAQMHFLNRLLGKKFEDKIACQLHEVFDLIGHEDNAVLRRNDLLPPTMDALSNQVSKLSEHGQLVYIENSNDIKQSWIIFKKEVLLSELNGSIFAPKHFESVYKDFSSTGVVALSKVKETFPHYDHDMLISFMNTLDFCHEIDKSDLPIIGGDQKSSDQEQYYFFPALVSTEKSSESCQPITKMSYKFGWCLHCKGNIFFSSRFLQVLLLRLAFTFALPDTSSTNEEESLAVERRMCNIWKNGIHWQKNGVETIVEVVEQNTAVVLVMGCFESSEIKCIQLRSAVIKTILSVQEKYSSAVDAEESFLHPDDLASYPLRSVESLFTFPLSTLKTAIKEREDALTNKIGRTSKMIPIDTLLFFEPYTCLKEDVICKLIEGSDQNKTLEGSDDFFNECAKVAHPKMALLKKILLLPEQDSEYHTAVKQCVDQYSDNPTHKCFHIFKTWQKFTPNPTYRGLREALDSYSIFRGRCPLP